MSRYSLARLLAATLGAAIAGCSCCHRDVLVPAGPPASPLPAPPSTYYSPGTPIPAPLPSMAAGDPQPPRYVPPAPPASAAYPPQDYGGFVPPPTVRRQQGGCPTPVPAIERQQGYFLPAPVAPVPGRPARPGVALAPPEPTPPSGAGAPQPAPTTPSATDPWPAEPSAPNSGTRLYPPQNPAAPPTVTDQPGAPSRPTPPPAVGNQPGTQAPQSPEPPRVKDEAGPSQPPVQRPSDGTPPLPVDIGRFAQARPNVSSGERPMPDGLTWLKKRGYKAVLYVREPGSDDAAARHLIEQAGLRYLSLEVSPQTLSREVVDRFNQIVTSPDNQPLFVFDDNGSLAGGLWYLHYRIVEKRSPEDALAAAGRLGFSDKSNVEMWLAIQKYLGPQKP